METGISCIMYFHGYRSYQKKRLKNKYGKYLMGMLVVTALVEELRVTPGKISIVVSTVIPLPKSSTKNSVSEASVAWAWGKGRTQQMRTKARIVEHIFFDRTIKISFLF